MRLRRAFNLGCAIVTVVVVVVSIISCFRTVGWLRKDYEQRNAAEFATLNRTYVGVTYATFVMRHLVLESKGFKGPLAALAAVQPSNECFDPRLQWESDDRGYLFLGFGGNFASSKVSAPQPKSDDGSVFIQSPDGFRWSSANLSIPLPLVLLVTLLPTIRMLIAYRRALRRGCIRCGYDLRATPNRCPECGMTAEPIVTPAKSPDTSAES